MEWQRCGALLLPLAEVGGAGLRLSEVQSCTPTPGVRRIAPGRCYSTPRIKIFEKKT